MGIWQSDVEGGGEGGASAFVDLDDAPAMITPAAVMVGNTNGDALVMTEAITVNENGVLEITQNTDSGIVITSNGEGGVTVVGNGGGGVSLSAAGEGGVVVSSNSASTDSGGVQITSAGPGGVTLMATSGGHAVPEGWGAVQIVANNGEGLILSVAKITVNNEAALATQSVLVAGVGTLIFTHGILTGFTPA